MKTLSDFIAKILFIIAGFYALVFFIGFFFSFWEKQSLENVIMTHLAYGAVVFSAYGISEKVAKLLLSLWIIILVPVTVARILLNIVGVNI